MPLEAICLVFGFFLSKSVWVTQEKPFSRAPFQTLTFLDLNCTCTCCHAYACVCACVQGYISSLVENAVPKMQSLGEEGINSPFTLLSTYPIQLCNGVSCTLEYHLIGQFYHRYATCLLHYVNLDPQRNSQGLHIIILNHSHDPFLHFLKNICQIFSCLCTFFPYLCLCVFVVLSCFRVPRIVATG